VCGRFVLFSEPGQLARLFEVDTVTTEPLPARFNVAPTSEVYAVAQARDGERRLGRLVWGFVPHWADGPRPGPINARAETVTRRPMFRDAFDRWRCLVPADGFYEWREDPDTGEKIPHYYHRRSGTPLAFAGLWSVWRPDGDAEPLRTCLIITTDAVGPVRDVHDRMPVALQRAHWDAWLDPNQGADDLHPLVVDPGLPDDLEVRVVSTTVNDARNEGAELIDPAPRS
jgi:putative SOS response-associated peptidase YedK